MPNDGCCHAIGGLHRGVVREQDRRARSRRSTALSVSTARIFNRAQIDLLYTSGQDGTAQRLRNLGVPESHIRKVLETHTNLRTVDWPAPASGDVIEKNVINGQRVRAGDELLSDRRSHSSLDHRRCGRNRSACRQDRHAGHGHGSRVHEPTHRGRSHLHLSRTESRNADRARAHRGAESRWPPQNRYVRRCGLPGGCWTKSRRRCSHERGD